MALKRRACPTVRLEDWPMFVHPWVEYHATLYGDEVPTILEELEKLLFYPESSEQPGTVRDEYVTREAGEGFDPEYHPIVDFYYNLSEAHERYKEEQ